MLDCISLTSLANFPFYCDTSRSDVSCRSALKCSVVYSNLFGAWIRFLGNTLYTLHILLHILARFFNVLCVHCFVRGSHRFTAIECWLLAKSWEYAYLISFRLSDMFRQIIDGKALADVMETCRMWVTLSLKLVTLKLWKLIAIAGCVVFKKIQHENRTCQKSYVAWFWFF